MTQLELARKVGISETQLSKIETDRVRPSAELRRRIAAVLGVSPLDIFPVIVAETEVCRD
jgi:transcriptional regulator with XRE-family HTH domain